MDKLVQFIDRATGRILVSYNNKRWTVGVEFGREGDFQFEGASYGTGETFEEALAIVLDEMGIK